jgi:hypothetical protein
MRSIKIDGNRDPVIENGKFVFVLDVDVVSQNCEQAMRQQLGEMNFDKDKGVQYFDNIFTGTPNFQRFEAQARTQLTAVDGVTGINSFSYSFNDNILSYDAEIITIYGSTTIAGTL